MQPGVDVEISKNQKDELILLGSSLEAVSQSAADIQQICRVRNKDIRKVCGLGCLPPTRRTPLTGKTSSWTVCTSRRRATSWRSRAGARGTTSRFGLLSGSFTLEWQAVHTRRHACLVAKGYRKESINLDHVSDRSRMFSLSSRAASQRKMKSNPLRKAGSRIGLQRVDGGVTFREVETG